MKLQFYMARRRFFVDEIRGGHAVIEGDDAHHLTRVLRVEAGQKYEISDNTNVYLAEIETAHKGLVSFSILDRIGSTEMPVRIMVAAALIKFDRFEWLIEKATELGVDSIVPFLAERSEKGLGHGAEKRVARWRKIAREASEQSRRSRLPQISEPVPFPETIAIDADMRVALEEQTGARPILRAISSEPAQSATVGLLAGPEGGWTDRERSGFVEAGWIPVSLGPTILRAETAVVAGIAVITAAWSAR
jgi:16S rRNA (uracil1498-N3)-methyltransferase